MNRRKRRKDETAMKAELIINCGCTIGEGPVWDSDSGKLYFIDNRQALVYCWNGADVEKVRKFSKKLGFVILHEQGGMVVGLEDGFYFDRFDGTQPRLLAAAEPGRTDCRFNDGKADPAGRAWGGTQTTHLDTGEGEVLPNSGLFCMDAGFQVKQVLGGVIQSNGLGWSADAKKFYFIDTERFCVQEFDYDIGRNELSNGRVCVEIPKEQGIPDGMTVDDNGNIWVALWGGYGVNCYDPATGALLERVELPVPNVTSCCFGGDGLDELYITTAAINTDLAVYPAAGGVFRVKPGVTGRPSYKFKG